jgi:hypothetical protein
VAADPLDFFAQAHVLLQRFVLDLELGGLRRHLRM